MIRVVVFAIALVTGFAASESALRSLDWFDNQFVRLVLDLGAGVIAGLTATSVVPALETWIRRLRYGIEDEIAYQQDQWRKQEQDDLEQQNRRYQPQKNRGDIVAPIWLLVRWLLALLGGLAGYFAGRDLIYIFNTENEIPGEIKVFYLIVAVATIVSFSNLCSGISDDHQKISQVTGIAALGCAGGIGILLAQELGSSRLSAILIFIFGGLFSWGMVWAGITIVIMITHFLNLFSEDESLRKLHGIYPILFLGFYSVLLWLSAFKGWMTLIDK